MRGALLLLVGCAPHSVHDRFNVVTGDAVLPVSVHGDLSSGTLILWEAGGPSGPSIAARTVRLLDFRDTLEAHAAIAYYDRRGVGNAHGSYHPDEITAEVLMDDLDAIGRVLEERYAPDRTVLMGHSFGGALSALYLAEGRGAFDQWVAVAPAWDGQDVAAQLAYRFPYACRVAADRASSGDPDALWQEVLTFCDAHDAVEEDTPEAETLGRYLAEIEDRVSPFPAMDPGGLMAAAFFSPYNLVDTQLRQNVVSEPVWESLEGIDLVDAVGEVALPTLVVTGEYDDIGNTEMATEAIAGLPDATLVELEGAGHYPFMDRPTDFEQAVLELTRR